MSDIRIANTKFEYRRLNPAEFKALMKRSGLSVDDFLYLAGRRREQIESFMAGRNDTYIPTMGDVLILELARLDEANIDDMMEIVDGYSLQPSRKEV